MNWKQQVSGEPSSPIVHDMDESKIYFACANNESEHSAGHDIFSMNTKDGTVAYTHRVPEVIEFPPMAIDQTVYFLSYNTGFLFEYDRSKGQPKIPFKTEYDSPSDSFPIFDFKKKMLYFGMQKAGFGAINLENRNLDFTDEINGRLILTALTLCNGQWGNNYEEKNWLYFGTRRCSTIRIPNAQNPKKTNTKCIDEMVKYDLNLTDIVWATEIDSTASAGAPVIDKWGQVLFSTESGKSYSLNAITGEEVWSQATGKEVLYGLAIPEDYQETRCSAQTIHFMDELVMMEKIMSDMFDDEDGMEQMAEFDRKSAQAVLNGDVDPLEVQDEEEFETAEETTEEAAEETEDNEGGIRDEL